MEAPKNSTCEIEEESPKFGSELASTVTDDSTKLEEKKNISGENKPETPRKSDKVDNSSSFYSSLLNKNNSKKTKKNDASNPTSAPAPPPPTPRSSQFTKSKSYSANVFRNLLSCGAVDANETAMVAINRREKNSAHIIPPKKPADIENVGGYGNAARICRGDKLGGSERVFRTSWHHEQKPHPDARQCGKMFKPEKLHKHMKSCRGMKSSAKGATSASVLETRRSSVDSACQESVSGYFLTADGSEFQ
ncbi:hypothetical protein RHGRI_019493 [Rhododendron griersonianum]|uniref:Uncharacterized protein n=1 Tax=Rhododendron griersonianum TaxID=479676 RepID=A0AAV6JCU4_9ERIC|nr:hypothetical protein RHGRI_019493 [Rhododendron griersonianum]